MKPRILFTDGEGPIVFKDLAADITEKIVPGLFPMISLYDDYLAEVGTEGYQAGDTLALAVPTFLAHGVTDEDIVEEVKDPENGAKVCRGVEEYIAGLKRDGYDVRIISTAYSPLWQLIGEHVGIPMEDIACTDLDLNCLRECFGSEEFTNAVLAAEQNILSLIPLGEEAQAEVDGGRDVVEVFEDPRFQALKEGLDGFYWGQLPGMGFRVLEETIVMGGKRKIEAARRFANDLGVEMSDVAYVGDSITDDAMHAHLSREGGLPIAINGNSYALRNARVAVATEDMRNIRPVLDAWQAGGFEQVADFVDKANETISFSRGREGSPMHEEDKYGSVRYDLVDATDQGSFDGIKQAHGATRKSVRGAAARLG